jgi:hypothetical protein
MLLVLLIPLLRPYLSNPLARALILLSYTPSTTNILRATPLLTLLTPLL